MSNGNICTLNPIKLLCYKLTGAIHLNITEFYMLLNINKVIKIDEEKRPKGTGTIFSDEQG